MHPLALATVIEYTVYMVTPDGRMSVCRARMLDCCSSCSQDVAKLVDTYGHAGPVETKRQGEFSSISRGSTQWTRCQRFRTQQVKGSSWVVDSTMWLWNAIQRTTSVTYWSFVFGSCSQIRQGTVATRAATTGFLAITVKHTAIFPA